MGIALHYREFHWARQGRQIFADERGLQISSGYWLQNTGYLLLVV